MAKEVQAIKPEALTPEIVKQRICPAANDSEIFLFLQIAKACNLNPFLNQIYLVKYGNQKAQILTSYNVYLQRAERSKKYAGLETSTEGKVADNSLKAIVKVYRKDWDKPLIHEVYYEEYVQKKHDGTVNVFWRTKPRTMIVKVAISQAFRLAFPLDFEGMPYTQDEINDIGVIDVEPKKTTVSMPKATQNQSGEGFEEAEIKESQEIEPEVEQVANADTEQSGVISVGSAKSLYALADLSGYTKEERLDVIGLLGYKKFVNILKQDLSTLIKGFGVKADVWRENKRKIEEETWND